jgi:lipid II:glycine glycyltransferase (peptidoglycan interpeptide bridge formation enzyme)
MLDGLGRHVRLLWAVHDGVVQGCAVLPFSTHAAYYVYGGSVPEPATGAMHLMHWEAIASFRAAGVQAYDFVGARIDPEAGSKQEGIATFKARFGGELRRGLIWKAPLRRVPWAVYGLGARLRSGGDIVDQERRRRSG